MNYRESDGPGTAWRRSHRVILENPIEGVRSATFLEQDVARVGDKLIAADAGSCRSVFDPSALVMLKDPETGENTGAYVTQAYVYQLMYSLYMDAAERRDGVNTATIEPGA